MSEDSLLFQCVQGSFSDLQAKAAHLDLSVQMLSCNPLVLVRQYLNLDDCTSPAVRGFWGTWGDLHLR